MLPEDLIVKKVLKATIKNFNGVTIQGAKGDIGATGPQGERGKDGVTPKKGEDYFTKEEIKQFVLQATPIKGVDYFDGKTPDEMIFVGKGEPLNPKKGMIWYKN